MPKVKPFKAIRYNPTMIGDISKVVAPPYDVIGPKLQDELYRKSEHNFVRIELNKITPSDNDSDNRYTRSRDLFSSWLKDGVMIADDKDAVYIYALKYKRGAKTLEQIGFIALMGLDLKGGNRVLPHENTLAAPKIDRLGLTRAVKANLSPIFVLYEDKAHALTGILKKIISKNRPLIDVKADDVRHRVWKLEESAAIGRIEAVIGPKEVFIADGHHRYEVSRMYCEETKGLVDHMMVYFVEMDERMLTILPAHRLLKDIGGLSKVDVLEKTGKFFYIEKAPSLKGMLAKMSKASKEHAFGMYAGNDEFYVLRLKSEKDPAKAIKDKPLGWKRLDVSILHQFILQHILGVSDDDDNVEFLKSAEETKKSVDSGKFKLAFFLNPTKVSDVKKIAGIGERMPRKATYFYPKPLSGLVVNKF